MGVQIPPPTLFFTPYPGWLRLPLPQLLGRLVRGLEAQLAVDLSLVGRVGVLEGGPHVAQGSYEAGDLVPGHPPLVSRTAEDLLGSRPPGLGLGDPAGDDGRI